MGLVLLKVSWTPGGVHPNLAAHATFRSTAGLGGMESLKSCTQRMFLTQAQDLVTVTVIQRRDSLGEQYGLLEQSLALLGMPIWRGSAPQGDEAYINVTGDFRFYRRGQALLVCDGIDARPRHDQRTFWRISQLCPRKLRRVQRPALHNQNERCRTHAGKPLNGAVSRLSSRFSPLSGPTPSSPRVFIVCRTAGVLSRN